MQQRTDESAGGTRQAEPEEHAPVEATAQQPKRVAVPARWGIETAATATRVPSGSASRGVKTLPMPNPATDAIEPATTAAAATVSSKNIARAKTPERDDEADDGHERDVLVASVATHFRRSAVLRHHASPAT
jgi:hypothetical protein